MNKNTNQHQKPNKLDARYQKSERKIKSALNSLLSHRIITLRVRDICRSAHLKPSTFYSHYKNPDQAFISIEDSLIRDFQNLINNTPSKNNPKKVLNFIFIFIYQNRSYFKTTNQRNNYYVLNQIVILARQAINSRRHTPELSLNAYYGAIVYLIVCWCQITNFDLNQSPRYINYILGLPQILDL